MSRNLAACLVLLAACSRGATPPDGEQSPDQTVDLAAAPDLAVAPDLAPARPGFLAPAWVWNMQGGLTTWGPFLAALPASGETGTADLLLTFTKGYEADDLVVGMGDPGQTLVQGKFKPVLAWLGGRDGKVLRVRQVAGDQSPAARSSVLPQAGASVGPGGWVVMGGQFHGSAVFNPGTGAAQSQATEQRLVGDTLHRAEDPYFVRYAADGTPGWLTRGRTPGPLTKTWFNYGQGVAALPDGGAAVAGLYESAGFVFGDGQPGAVTFGGGGGGYVARLGAQGAVTWALRNSGGLAFWNGVRAAPDGSIYLLGRQSGDAVLAADTQKVALPVPAGQRAFPIIKLGPDGAVRWVRRLLTAGIEGPGDFAVTADGRVLIAGSAAGEMTLRGDGDAALATVPTVPGQDARGFAASLGPDGAVQWMIALGPGVDAAGPVALRPDGQAWVIGWTTGAAGPLPLDGGGPVALPEGLTKDTSVPLLYRLSAAGKRTAAHVLGANLPVSGVVATADGGVAIAGGYADGSPEARVGAPAEMGGSRALPPCTSMLDQRLFVIALRPAP